MNTKRYFESSGEIQFLEGMSSLIDSELFSSVGDFKHVGPDKVVKLIDDACAHVIAKLLYGEGPKKGDEILSPGLVSLMRGVRPATADCRIRFHNPAVQGCHLLVRAALLEVRPEWYQIGFEASDELSGLPIASGVMRFVSCVGEERVDSPFAAMKPIVAIARSIIDDPEKPLVPLESTPVSTSSGRVGLIESNNSGKWHGGHFMRAITAASLMRFEKMLRRSNSRSQFEGLIRGGSLVAVVAEEITLKAAGHMNDFPSTTTQLLGMTSRSVVFGVQLDALRTTLPDRVHLGHGKVVLALTAPQERRLKVVPHGLRLD